MMFPTDCYSCGKTGFANMCIASIPFFKEIIIMAYNCEYCGYRNTEIKSGGGISEKATRIVYRVEKPEDLNRDVFKSETCVLAIPELDFAMAPGTLGSHYTTVEGLLDKIGTSLKENNPFGMGDSSNNDKFLKFLDKMNALRTMENGEKFTLVLDDAASNCFIYNPFAPENDP
jgi:zinc finger protein